jgi:hypothetical protein
VLPELKQTGPKKKKKKKKKRREVCTSYPLLTYVSNREVCTATLY